MFLLFKDTVGGAQWFLLPDLKRYKVDPAQQAPISGFEFDLHLNGIKTDTKTFKF